MHERVLSFDDYGRIATDMSSHTWLVYCFMLSNHLLEWLSGKREGRMWHETFVLKLSLFASCIVLDFPIQPHQSHYTHTPVTLNTKQNMLPAASVVRCCFVLVLAFVFFLRVYPSYNLHAQLPNELTNVHASFKILCLSGQCQNEQQKEESSMTKTQND